MSSPIQYYNGSGWTDVTPVGNISVAYGISGIGTSGVSTRSLHFDAGAEWISLSERCAIAAPDGHVYYINNRSGGINSASFDCVDGCALLDQAIDLSNAAPSGQVVPGADNRYKMDNSYLGADVIVSQIYTGCGISVISLTAPEAYGFKRATIEGMTYMELLTNLSEIHCGFYTMTSSNTLGFIPLKETGQRSVWVYGRDEQHGGRDLIDHSHVIITGQYTLSNVLIQGRKDTEHNTSYTLYPYTIFSVSTYNMLEINNCFSEFADPSEFPIGTTYVGWKCDNVLTIPPPLGQWVKFQENGRFSQELRVTDVSARYIGGQWLTSMSGGLPSGGEIQRRSRRQMETDKKITANQTGFEHVFTPYQDYYKEKEDEQSG